MRARTRMPNDDHLAILHSLESALATLYKEQAQLTDYDVSDAFDALVRHYKAQQTQRIYTHNLKGRSKEVLEQLQGLADMYLGTAELQDPETNEPLDFGETGYTLEDILSCFKRLQSSLKLWTKEGGRQGYLNYISQFV